MVDTMKRKSLYVYFRPLVVYTQYVCVHLYHYALRVIATVAPAEARSWRALELLVATLGRLLLFVATAAPVLVRLVAVEMRPFTVDCLRGAEFLMGLEPDTSLDLTAVECLKLVTGGSGRGLLVEGVVMVLLRLIGDSVLAVMRAVGTDDF